MSTIHSLRAFALIAATATVVLLAAWSWKSPVSAQVPNDRICLQNAVIERTNGFIEAYNRYHASMLRALTSHRDSSVSAYAMADAWKRDDELRRVSLQFTKEYNASNRALTAEKRGVMNAYNSAARSCRVTQPPPRSSRGSASDCFCTLQYDPVCGADGKTYSNACFARCNNTSVSYKGTCR